MLHIGHHFFGSGNIGDDLMLAGFLRAVPPRLKASGFSCCSPFDLECQRRRFPEVQWLAYDSATRAAAIDAAHAWLGVGDTPFQTDVGAWFLEHLIEDARLCRRSNTPMFFVGVGLNNRAAIDHPHTRTIVEQASHIWTRDVSSATYLRSLGAVTPGADLANVYLAARQPPPVERGTLAFLLNFEDPASFALDAICDTIDRTPGRRHLWLVQEVRPLPGSEREIYSRLPSEYRDRLEVRAPDYGQGSIPALLGAWGTPETVVTSRYHGALSCAWSGSRVAVIERNDKLTGLVETLQVPSARDFHSGAAIVALLERAVPVSRETLTPLSDLAERSVRALVEALGP
jgi:hypothetical protein